MTVTGVDVSVMGGFTDAVSKAGRLALLFEEIMDWKISSRSVGSVVCLSISRPCSESPGRVSPLGNKWGFGHLGILV